MSNNLKNNNKKSKKIISKKIKSKNIISKKINKYRNCEKTNNQIQKYIKQLKSNPDLTVYDRIYTYKRPILYNIMAHDKDLNVLKQFGKTNSYHYKELNKLHNKYCDNYIYDYDDQNYTIKTIVDDFARGIARYLTNNYELEYKITNGFAKLWEIYSLIDDLLPNKKKLNLFHLAEAPGQWIYCSNYYTRSKLSKVKEYEWRSTSLNPDNEENKKKYGNDIFSDHYGFIGKYPDNWLWGKDDTGDITKTENMKWYREYVKKWSKKVDIITGDGGIDSIDIEIVQKLDLAQLFMVLSVGTKGSNCVIKTFLPYIRKVPETYYASGLYMNILYLYYLFFDEMNLVKPLTSSPKSGEYYIVCKEFKGINDKDYNKIISIMDEFEPNMCFFKKNDIPKSFVKQITDFIITLGELNNKFNDLGNILNTCMKNKKDRELYKKTDCESHLNIKTIKNIQKLKFEKWITDYKFE